MCKARFANEGQLTEVGGRNTFFWKGLGDDQPRIDGAGLAIKTLIASNLADIPKGHSARLVSCRLPLKNKQHMTIIIAYAPTLTSPDEDKDAFTVNWTPCSHLFHKTTKYRPILLEISVLAWGQSITNDHVWLEGMGLAGWISMGSFFSNCAPRCITNTVFRVPTKYETSWQHPRSRHSHLIDYIITRQRDQKDTLITRAMRGACCWTDHNLIRSKLRIRLAPRHKAKDTCIAGWTLTNWEMKP